jgi:aconitate hydratase 2/2-methylisocitrate dehydratase
MDFRDVVHATQSQMLKQFGGECIPGRIIEVRDFRTADQALRLQLDSRDESESFYLSETLIESLIAKRRIQIMIDKGMDNESKFLKVDRYC